MTRSAQSSPFISNIDVDRQDACAVAMNEAQSPHVQCDGSLSVFSADVLDSLLNLTDRQYAEVHLILRDR